MRDPEKDKMLENATYLLNLFTDDSISETENMGSIRERCLKIMTKEDIERASAFLESGEAGEYLRNLAIAECDLEENT